MLLYRATKSILIRMISELITTLAQARKAARITQADLAERAGLSRMAVQRTETGDVDPRFSTLQEMARVVVPGGWVYCLDSFVPDSLVIRPFYSVYFRYVMPFLGGGFRHRQEYTWLWQSTQDFLRKKELLDLFGQAGLIDRQMKSRLFGACVLHKGKKPAVE